MTDWLQLIGTVGGLLFASACIPMAYKTWRVGGDIGTPILTIWTFVLATLLFTIYLQGKLGWQMPVLLTVVEFACWSLALWYHYFPRVTKQALVAFLQSYPPVAKDCTRHYGHTGPCNGWPRPDCPGYQDWISTLTPGD